MKKTAFHEVNLKHGADMRELFGYHLPWEYSPGALEEHISTRQKVSLCDLGYMGKFSIEGPGAQSFVQTLFTRDTGNMKSRSIKYTAMCFPEGTMVDDGTIWKLTNDKFLFISGDEEDYTWISEIAKNFDVNVKNITSEHTTLALQGPKSKDVLSRVTDIDLEKIRYYNFQSGEVAGVDCVVARMGYTGEFGYEIHFHPDSAKKVWTAIMKAGKKHGIVPCGQAALESLRQEAGYLLVGNDHDKSTNPLEAGIGWTVDFAKGGFYGKDALLDILREGVKRRLVWFKIPGGQVARKGDPITSGYMRIGEVTSGSFSPTFDQGTAMGYVRPEFSIHGVDFVIEIQGKSCKAKLSVMPPYDPGDLRSSIV
jgi:aminomethyltransferase